jgi:raffinose/stachyose/melibiose transport system substrate-binding protein
MKTKACLLGVAATLLLVGASAGAPARAADPVVVTVWSWSPVTPTMNAMIAAIQKAHPDIQVKATIQPHPVYSVSLQAAVGSGNMPDIVGLSPGSETQQYREHLLNLSPVAEELWGKDWQKNFSPSLLSEARFGNPQGDANFYALPQEAQLSRRRASPGHRKRWTNWWPTPRSCAPRATCPFIRVPAPAPSTCGPIC